MIVLLQICEYSIVQEFYIYSVYSQKPLTIVVKLCISDNWGGPLDRFVNIYYTRIKKSKYLFVLQFYCILYELNTFTVQV